MNLTKIKNKSNYFVLFVAKIKKKELKKKKFKHDCERIHRKNVNYFKAHEFDQSVRYESGLYRCFKLCNAGHWLNILKIDRFDFEAKNSPK